MIKIIPSANFVTTPWKNGKGITTELAISPNGTLENFDWRLSIASVSENGLFSNFSGYLRNLVLIEGQGITLIHNENTRDELKALLDFATFDGGSSTYGEITQGVIKDFNVMTASARCQADVKTYPQCIEQNISCNGLVFFYSISSDISVSDRQDGQRKVKQGDLLQLSSPNDVVVSGEGLIVVSITNKCHI